MATLAQISQNLQLLRNKESFYEEVLRIASRFEAYLVDLNQIQLSGGKNILGETIGGYSEAAERIAETENTRKPKIQGETYNFEWTGQLFDGMYLRATSEYIEIFSTAPHATIVSETYSNLFGENVIFGLTEEHLIEFVQKKLMPEVRRYVCRTMNLAA